ncbi:OmpA family protein [Pedobacter duraquae]|uniref:Outer membrane protein OmpA-like peptidoglycan-associated protein n=1 Tax=Pedobacter duraquae TaxID=425511 RepID=A0A4R6IRS4_9SPHI|nr:OmpA family protein [Pedobacter duraquae]TDO24656.1 outer membrane protein OmpA-like peptidoglycan-associated protein [Pedobacter duraquae]
MAELDVQPKKKNPIVWIILVLIALALLFFLMRGCNESKTTGLADTTTRDTLAKTVVDWNQVDFNTPDTTYEEVTDTGIVIRSTSKYTIYGIGENILFAKDQSEIQRAADVQLQQIAASLKKRFNGASLAVYGNTDATGTAEHNKKLGASRAEVVKDWLIQNGFSADLITVQSKGESDPVATNATEKGKKLNRSVEIVALAAK